MTQSKYLKPTIPRTVQDSPSHRNWLSRVKGPKRVLHQAHGYIGLREIATFNWTLWAKWNQNWSFLRNSITCNAIKISLCILANIVFEVYTVIFSYSPLSCKVFGVISNKIFYGNPEINVRLGVVLLFNKWKTAVKVEREAVFGILTALYLGNPYLLDNQL